MDTPLPPTLNFAEIYDVSQRTIRRWRAAGIDLTNPLCVCCSYVTKKTRRRAARLAAGEIKVRGIKIHDRPWGETFNAIMRQAFAPKTTNN